MDEQNGVAATFSLWKLGWIFAIAAFAGVVNYIQRFASETPPPWRWGFFFVKILTAGFAGLLTHWLLSKWGWGDDYVNFAVAIAGYGGAETIVFLQTILFDAIRRKAEAASNAPPKA